jgi:outer membrane protein OmpA-like peptidoglycan-associated protein
MINISRGLDRFQEENPFAMSIGDLMAALLLIFVLLLSSTLLRIQQDVESYHDVQVALYNDLRVKFSDRLDLWNAEIDSSLTVRFKEPDIYFQTGQALVKPRFKAILDEFFPDYIEVLTRDAYIGSIEEVRIEGHTSSEWAYGMVDSATAYFKNMQLSQDRTRSVLEYALFTLHDTTGVLKKWVQSKIAAIGLSSSKPKYVSGIEEKEASRRVEFKVRTDAEKRIKELIGRRQNVL